MDDMVFLEKDYIYIRPLGSRGGMGDLFRARKRSLGVEVVIKKVKSKYKGKVDQENEANILKNLKHQYLPRIYDVILSDNGYVYTIMDYIPGQNLNEFVKKNGRASQKDAYRWACQLCEVVKYLHSQNPPIIHCDIKPANIMITPKGDICLIDFNTSLVFYDGALAVGTTTGYAAPEQYVAFGKNDEHLRNVLRQKNIEGGGSGEIIIPIPHKKNDRNNYFHDLTEPMREDTTLLTEVIDYGQTDAATEVLSATMSQPSSSPSRSAGKSTYRSFTSAETSRAGGYGSISIRTDIYAIGASLYFAVTGHVPEKSLGPVTDISLYKPAISVLFQNIIRRSMEKMQTRRFSNIEEMSRALSDIGKLDVRYRRYRKLRTVCFAGFIVLFLSGVLCTAYGYKTIGTERENTYFGLISQSESYADSGDYEASQKVIDEAINMMPSREEAYMSRAVELYNIGLYEEALEVFDNAIESESLNEWELEESVLSNICYIKANCFSELEDYETAIKLYERALSYSDSDIACYRGLALTQARMGDTEEAKATLDSLLAAGGSDTDSDLVSAEIYAASGDTDEAIQKYKQVIISSEDEEILRHCYVSAAKIYSKNGDSVSEIELLEEALSALNNSPEIQMKEMLAEAYAGTAEKGISEQKYNQRAKELFSEMIENGGGTIATHLNLASVEQKMGEYGNAEQELLELLEEYPYDYRVDMRLAFLYADWQSKKNIDDRDYTEVESYYKKACSKYETAKANGKQDADMAILDNLIKQLKAADWL